MKIYTKVVFDMNTGIVEEAEFFDYEGPVALAKGGASAAPSTTTVQQNSVPEFLESAYLESIDRARSVSGENYIPYEGQRYAGFTPEQEQSFQMTQQGIGQFMPVYNAGVASTAAASSPFTAGALDSYMDPYRSQVVDEIGRRGNENFTQNIMPGINSQFTGGGMFGSSRQAKALGEAAQATQRDITGAQSQALSSGFQNSMQNYQTDMQRMLAAGQQLGNQAGQGQQLYGADVNALAGVGAQKQGQTQNLLDIAYNSFLEQQQYPQAQAQWFSNIVRGIPQEGMITKQRQDYSANNPVMSALGIGGNLYGAMNQQLNKGGHIKAKKQKAKRNSAPKKQSGGIGGFAYA